jgi:hypothetical protein
VTNPNKGRITTRRPLHKEKPAPATTVVPLPPQAAPADPSEGAGGAGGRRGAVAATAQATRQRVVDAKVRVDELTAPTGSRERFHA